MFFLLFLVLFVVVSILAELEWFIGAGLVVVVGVIGVHYLHFADVFAFVRDNAVYLGIGAVVYAVVGVLWAPAKWALFLVAFRDHIHEIRDQFASANGLSPNGLDFHEAFKEHLVNYYPRFFRGNYVSRKPRVIDNKGRIIAWMTLWPWSMFGTFLNDVVRKFFEHVFNRMKGMLQSMTDRILKDVRVLSD